MSSTCYKSRAIVKKPSFAKKNLKTVSKLSRKRKGHPKNHKSSKNGKNVNFEYLDIQTLLQQNQIEIENQQNDNNNIMPIMGYLEFVLFLMTMLNK